MSLSRGHLRAGAVLAAACVAAVAACAPIHVAPPPRVFLYGDSLAREASAYLDPARFTSRAVGGSAPCDAFAVMAQDARLHPGRVIVAYSGNMATACTRAWPDRLAAYRAMLGTVAGLWSGVPVTLVGAPDSINGAYPYTVDVRALTAAFAAAHRIAYIDGSTGFAGLPRASDGFHFCPGPRDPTTATCLVASPAAAHYARLIGQ